MKYDYSRSSTGFYLVMRDGVEFAKVYNETEAQKMVQAYEALG